MTTRRILMAITVVLLIWLAGEQFWFTVQSQKQQVDIPNWVALDSSRGYLLNTGTEQQLIYTLSQSPEKLWIASTSVLAAKNNKTAKYNYSLIVEVLDKTQQVLFEKAFSHQTSEAKLVSLTDSEEFYPEYFLGDTERKLSTTESFHIALPAGATTLKIRQVSKAKEILDISIKAYQYVQRSSRVDANSVWERLSQKQKHRLTANYPFDLSLLSEDEKANLAEYRWQPIVPSGDEGSDYFSVLIYQIPKEYIAEKGYLLSRYEHQSDIYKKVSFPIEIAGVYRVQGRHEFTPREYQVFMRWHDPEDKFSRQYNFSFADNNFQQDMTLQPGLLTLTSSLPVSLDVFAVSGFVEEHDHFSSPIMLLPGDELRYELAQVQDQDVPLQIQVRPFAEQQRVTKQQAHLTIEKIREGSVIDRVHVYPDFVPEENVQFADEEFFNWLSAATLYYLEENASVDEIKLTSNQPLLVNIFTRISDMPAIRVLPEEKRDWFDYPSGVSDWFAMRPQQWDDLLNKGRVRLLRHYHRSLQEEQQLVEPDETYQSLLTDFESQTLVDVMVQNPYKGMPTETTENVALNFAPLTEDFTGHSTATDEAKLFFVRDSDKPTQIQWRHNRQQQAPFWIVGRWGIIDAGVMGKNKAGTISLPSEDIQWYRSGVSRENAVWQQRRALLLSPTEKVTVTGSKQRKQEMLSFTAFTTGDSPVSLSISLQKVQRDKQVHDSFTILKRQYQIQPQEWYSGFQLSGERRIKGRQSFSILLGEDIQNGDFQLFIEHLGGEELFLSVVSREIPPQPVLERFRSGVEH